MTDLPSDSVALLCAHIKDSPQLRKELGDRYTMLLTDYRRLLHAACASVGGHEVEPINDAFLASFPSRQQALDAALAIQRILTTHTWPNNVVLRARMVLHTGAVSALMRSSIEQHTQPISQLGVSDHIEQIVLTDATIILVVPGLRADDPPPDLASIHPNNLPPQLTSFIGRERETAAIREQLLRQEVRLLTVTGAGGIGKTRLALRVAADMLDVFPDGIFFVNLAPLIDPDLVVSTIAHTLDIHEPDNQMLLTRLQDYLQPKCLLLILDNFEHLVAAAVMIAELLKAAPRVKLLVTSRAVLHLNAEHEYSLRPLALPDPQHLADLQTLSHSESVALFLQRVQASMPDFVLTHAHASAIAEICVRLDGLPLAIELAAARIKLLPPQTLLSRLANRLGVLTGGKRDLPMRQRTLRDTIDWSYHLLNAGEQHLFVRLAVFVGGCTLEAAETVCNATADLPIDVLDGLASLLDQSLLHQIQGPAGEARFGMLEMLREYALERLLASGEVEDLRQHHARFYLQLAEMLEPALSGPDQIATLDRLETEQGNLHIALSWALEQQAWEIAVRLGSALRRFWLRRGHLAEWRRWLAAGLSAVQDLPDGMRAKALWVAGNLAVNANEYTQARMLLEESLILYRQLHDDRGSAWALFDIGCVACVNNDQSTRALLEESLSLAHQVGDGDLTAWALVWLGELVAGEGDLHTAATLYHESERLFQAHGDTTGIARTRYKLAGLTMRQGDAAQATMYYHQALALYREIGERSGIADSLFHLANLARDQGDFAQATLLYDEVLGLGYQRGNEERLAALFHAQAELARMQGDDARAWALAQESLARYQSLGAQRRIGYVLSSLGYIAQHRGDYRQARALHQEGLRLFQDVGEQEGCITCLAGLAGVATSQGAIQRAARIFGAVEALHEAIQCPAPAVDQLEREHNVGVIRAQLAAPTFQSAWATGRTLTLEQAITEALALNAPDSLATSPFPSTQLSTHPAGLTARELEVLRLLAQGLTYDAIAEHLVISPRTVNRHLTSIYGKLGVSSRHAATRWAIDNQVA
jgi:predicted ATPase/DNA-binding CsgD family transcriptional regulator